MESSQIFRIMLCFVSMAELTWSYSTGPPEFACTDMRPQHGVPGQITPSPYTVSVNKTTFEEQEQISVTIRGDLPFRGVMLQARSIDLDTHVGNFQADTGPNPQLKTLACGQGNALTHGQRLNVNTITVTWTAPARTVGTVKMTATVVREHTIFWVKVDSAILTQTFPRNLGPPVPVGGVGQTTCAAPNEAFTLAPLSTDSYLVKWTYIPCSTPPEVEFDVTAKITDTSFGNSWVAIGFSKDEFMGDDSVVECTQLNNNLVAIRYSYNANAGKNNIVLSSSIGLTAISASVARGNFNCKFRRHVTVAGSSRIFDLSAQQYRLLVARGTSDATGLKTAHNLLGGKRPVISTKFIDFLKSDSLKTIN